MLLVFLDTETTGLDPEKHRAVEIALKVVEAASGQVVVSYESLVAQPAEVWAEADPESLKINGFSYEKCLAGKSEAAVAGDISGDLNRAGLGEKEGVFVCQNPSFDRAFFSQIIGVELQDGYSWPYHWLDLASMFWAVKLKKGERVERERELSKNQIAKSFNLEAEAMPHRAMQGVEHLILCYNRLFELG